MGGGGEDGGGRGKRSISKQSILIYDWTICMYLYAVEPS